MEIGRSRDLNREELINRNNENRTVIREPAPRVIDRSNEIQNRSTQRQTNPQVTPPVNVQNDRGNVNRTQVNREATRENKPNYNPQRVERSREIQRESAPQQRVERRSGGNERNNSSSNGSRERRR